MFIIHNKYVHLRVLVRLGPFAYSLYLDAVSVPVTTVCCCLPSPFFSSIPLIIYTLGLS